MLDLAQVSWKQAGWLGDPQFPTAARAAGEEFLLVAPRAPVEQASTARGARNFVPKKVRLREEPLHPQPRCAHLCPSGKIDGPPPKTPDTPLPRLRFIGSCPKCEKRRPPSIHHRQPPWLVAISAAAHPPSASALRSLFVPRACRCSFSQSKGDAAATTACLLPRAISPPMLTALRFCLASADRICLLRRCIIITDFANVLADMPMSCVGSSLLHEPRLRSLGLELGEDTPPSHRCATSTTM